MVEYTVAASVMQPVEGITWWPWFRAKPMGKKALGREIKWRNCNCKHKSIAIDSVWLHRERNCHRQWKKSIRVSMMKLMLEIFNLLKPLRYYYIIINYCAIQCQFYLFFCRLWYMALYCTIQDIWTFCNSVHFKRVCMFTIMQ